jgi:hypothetical protein
LAQANVISGRQAYLPLPSFAWEPPSQMTGTRLKSHGPAASTCTALSGCSQWPADTASYRNRPPGTWSRP